MTLDELYKEKGRLITQGEAIQQRLQQVNVELAKAINTLPRQEKANLAEVSLKQNK